MVDAPQEHSQPTGLQRRIFEALPNRCCVNDPHCPYDWHEAIKMADVVTSWLDESLTLYSERVSQAANNPFDFVEHSPGEYLYRAKGRAVRGVISNMAREGDGDA